MGGLYRRGDLLDNTDDLLRWKWGLSFGVLLEQLPGCPLHDEVVESVGQPDFYGSDDVGVIDPLAELRFAGESGNCGLLLAKLLAENLEGDGPVLGMFGPIDDRRSPFTYELLERIAGNDTADEVFGHGAEPNGQRSTQQGDRGRRRNTGIIEYVEALFEEPNGDRFPAT